MKNETSFYIIGLRSHSVYEETQLNPAETFVNFNVRHFSSCFFITRKETFNRLAENVSIFKTKSLFPQQMLFPQRFLICACFNCRQTLRTAGSLQSISIPFFVGLSIRSQQQHPLGQTRLVFGALFEFRGPKCACV